MEELSDLRYSITAEVKEADVKSADKDDVNDVNRSKVQRIKGCLRTNVYLIAVMVCVALGLLIGFGLRTRGRMSEDALMWLGFPGEVLTRTLPLIITSLIVFHRECFPGEVFMRSLQLIITPLIVTSVITGAATLDPQTNGKITGAALLYMAAMNGSSTLVGLTMFYVIRPHTGIATQASSDSTSTSTATCFGRDVKLSTGDIFADMIRNVFPDNMVTACFQKAQTYYKKVEVGQECGANVTVTEYVRSLGSAGGVNILGLILFCLLIGIACGKVGEKARPFVDFFAAACDVIMLFLTWVIWLTPMGVLSLIATSIVRVENIESSMTGLALFAVTVIAAVIFLVLVEAPLIYFIFIRKNPFAFLFQAIRPMMTAFAPPSSAIAIPEIINVAENVYGVDPVISRFCTMFGAATCRFGSAAFIVISSLFLASLEGDVDAGQVTFMAVLTVAVTFAVPSVPSASILCVLLILSSLNVQSSSIGMILALEWLLDRVRTAANALANLNGNLIINKLFG